MINAIFLFNPAAGRGLFPKWRVKQLLKALTYYGIQCEVVITQPSGESLAEARMQNKDLFIVWGGDGTFHQALPWAIKYRVPIALLPGGTANVLARELGIPLDWRKALRVLSRHKRQRMFLGQTTGKYFHLMAGIGFDAFVVSQVNRRLKRVLGTPAYWLTAVTCLSRYPLKSFLLKVDGESFRATSVVIGNARNYGGRLLVTPSASVFENCLDVCIFTSQKKSRYVSYFLGTLSGRHLMYKDVIYRKAQCVELMEKNLIPIQMDGEFTDRRCIEFSTYGKGIEVLVP